VQPVATQLLLFPQESAQPGQVPGFSVRESGRAKRLSIKVFPRGRVEVVVPRRTRPADVEAFVSDNQAWIARALAAFAADHPPEDFELPNLIRLPAIDRVTRVRYVRRREAKSVRYRHSGDVLTLTGNIGSDKHCVAALRRWLSATAKCEFEPRLRALSILTDSPFERMHVRAQKSCWGSRSSSGTISLNLCLLFLDVELLRYLLIHELCHGRHMNHSKRFWKCVGKFEPEYRRLDRELSDAWRHVPAWLGLY